MARRHVRTLGLTPLFALALSAQVACVGDSGSITWSTLPSSGGDVLLTLASQDTLISPTTVSAFSMTGTCTSVGSPVKSLFPVESTTTCGKTGTWSLTLDLSHVSDGTIVFILEHTRKSDSIGVSIESPPFYKTTGTPTPHALILTPSGFNPNNLSGALSVSWSGASDSAGNSLSSHEFSAGTSAGSTDLLDWTAFTPPSGSQNATLDLSGTTLVDGQSFYINLRGSDVLGNLTSSASSSAILVDQSIPLLLSGVTSSSPSSYSRTQSPLMSWSPATDIGSGITAYEYAIGYYTGDTSIRGWTSLGISLATIAYSLSLTYGQDYYFSVRAVDAAGNRSLPASASWRLSSTNQAPIPITTSVGNFIEHTAHTLTLTYLDLDGDLASACAITASTGMTPTSPCSCDPAGQCSVSVLGNAQFRGLASVTFSITAGGQTSVTPAFTRATWIADTSAPSLTGALAGATTSASTSSSPLFTWSAAQDEAGGSGILSYQYRVLQLPGGSLALDWTDAGASLSATASSLNLTIGTEYQFQVRALDYGSNPSSTLSKNWEVLDPTPKAIGAISIPVWESTDLTQTPERGTRGAGMLTGSPYLHVDSQYLYASDSSNNLVYKYDRTSGALIGWIGSIAQGSPVTSCTGGSPPNVTIAPAITAGWCIGGIATSSAADGGFNTPRGIWGDSTHLYVVDSGNSRLVKIDLATGAFVAKVSLGSTSLYSIFGDENFVYVASSTRVIRVDKATFSTYSWIGKIGSATGIGGAGSCAGSIAGEITPDWCTGGTATSLLGDGGFQGASAIWADATYLYIGDGSRLLRHRKDTGAFAGWLGLRQAAAAAPKPVLSDAEGVTGGSCASMSTTAYSATPNWCASGSVNVEYSTSGTQNIFQSILSIWGDGTHLYLLNSYSSGTHSKMLKKIQITQGIFIGWSGQLYNTTQVNPWSTSGTWDAPSPSPMPYLSIPSANTLTGYGDSLFTGHAGYWLKHAVSTGLATAWSGVRGSSLSNQWIAETPSPLQYFVSTFANAGLGSPKGISLYDHELYVSESSTSRVQKFDRVTGETLGWIGMIDSLTDLGGDVLCSLLAIGSLTESWCTGGRSDYQSSHSILSFGNGLIAAGSDSLLVGSGYQINHFDRESGSYLGWHGVVQSTTGLGGALGCNTTAAGDVTPTWCKGGSGLTSGTLNSFGGATSLITDGTYAYFTTMDRVHRVLLSTGETAGWLGKIGTSPTGGAGSCAGASINTYTPQWCSGGASVSQSSNTVHHLGFYSPKALWADDTYLYLVSGYGASSYHHIKRLNKSTGAFAGLIGKITSGYTSGWPTSSVTLTDLTSSLMSSGFSGIWGDSTALYAIDNSGNRVVKFDKITGTPIGWKGLIGTAPTASDSSIPCRTAIAGSFTPDWCSTGTTTREIGLSASGFYSPSAITGDDGYLYISDTSNHRIVRIAK